MEKREAELKSLFTKEMKRQLPGFLMLSYATNGAPDRTIIGQGVQTNWEFKHATPDFRSPGDQELMCMRLAAAGHCRYVIWHEVRSIQTTMIVHPHEIHYGHNRILISETRCSGFDMKWLVEYIRKEHTK